MVHPSLHFHSHTFDSGIGLETTILFLREGASVLMTDISESGLSKAMAKAKELSPHMTGTVDTMKCDVTKETDVMAVVERVDEWGGVDVMFNNAGIMHGQDDGETLNKQVANNVRLLTTFQTPSPPLKRSGI